LSLKKKKQVRKLFCPSKKKKQVRKLFCPNLSQSPYGTKEFSSGKPAGQVRKLTLFFSGTLGQVRKLVSLLVPKKKRDSLENWYLNLSLCP
jgi:hypothetical protein